MTEVTNQPLGVDQAEFTRLALQMAFTKKRVERAKSRLASVEAELADAEAARALAGREFQRFVQEAAANATEPDLFDTEERLLAALGGQDALDGYFRDLNTRTTLEERMAPGGDLHAAPVISGGRDLPPQPIPGGLIVEEAPLDAPTPDGFHIGACGVGEFAGVCKYGEATCPVLNDPEAEIEERQAEPGLVEITQDAAGRVTILVGERTLARGGGLSPVTIPGGRIEDLPVAEEYHIFRDLTRDAWMATTEEETAAGPARINIGAFTPSWDAA